MTVEMTDDDKALAKRLCEADLLSRIYTEACYSQGGGWNDDADHYRRKLKRIQDMVRAARTLLPAAIARIEAQDARWAKAVPLLREMRAINMWTPEASETIDALLGAEGGS